MQISLYCAAMTLWAQFTLWHVLINLKIQSRQRKLPEEHTEKNLDVELRPNKRQTNKRKMNTNVT